MTVGQILGSYMRYNILGMDGQKGQTRSNLGGMKKMNKIFIKTFLHVIHINMRKFFRPKHFFYINHIVIEIALLKYSVIFFLQFHDYGP